MFVFAFVHGLAMPWVVVDVLCHAQWHTCSTLRGCRNQVWCNCKPMARTPALDVTLLTETGSAPVTNTVSLHG
jgi:hypothetical protein